MTTVCCPERPHSCETEIKSDSQLVSWVTEFMKDLLPWRCYEWSSLASSFQFAKVTQRACVRLCVSASYSWSKLENSLKKHTTLTPNTHTNKHKHTHTMQAERHLSNQQRSLNKKPLMLILKPSILLTIQDTLIFVFCTKIQEGNKKPFHYTDSIAAHILQIYLCIRQIPACSRHFLSPLFLICCCSLKKTLWNAWETWKIWAK